METQHEWTRLVDGKILARWLEKEGLGNSTIDDVEALAGGTQNVLIGFTHNGNRLVLRRPSANPRPGANRTMEREARMLAALAGCDVPHPRLIAACTDTQLLGTAFYVMEAVDGFNATQGLSDLHSSAPVQHEMGLALVDAIVALGEVDHHAVGLGDFGKPENFLHRQVARWSDQLESYSSFPDWAGPKGLPHVARIAKWLETNRPPEARPGILHGDYHLANVMYRHDGPQLAAVIDWELTTIGDPLLDLGWLLATWPGEDIPIPSTLDIQPWVGFPTGDELVSRYASKSERDLSAMDWYTVLACYKLAIILEGTNARASAGKADPQTAVSLHQGAVGLLTRANNISS